MITRAKIIWSPVEIDYLKDHIKDPVDQLCIALSKSKSAVNKKKKELITGIVEKPQPRRTNIGKRHDLGIFMRSSWEANVARWFTNCGYSWEYEPKTFFFDQIKHGTVSYLPDFRIEIDGEFFWIEVKGYLDSKGRAAIRRFQKYYPAEASRLVAIVGRVNTKADKFFKKQGIPVLAYMSELNKDFSHVISNWE